ncbi:MAG: glycosyltransferase family 4 protein, partial [Armatimonadota bacterium]
MRILIVGHTYVVGINHFKLKALTDTKQVDVGLLVPERWYEPEWKRVFELEKPFPEIKVYPARVAFAGRGGAYFYPPSVIKRTIVDFKPDLIHVEQEVFSICAFQFALVSRLIRRPLSFFCWENIDRPLALRRLTRKVVLRTAALVVAGNRDAVNLIRCWGFKGKVAVLPQLGVDTELFKPPAASKSSQCFTIGFFGRLVHQKGIDLLLKATAMLRERGHSVRLWLVGTGPDEDHFRRLASELGIDQFVEWLGAVPHMQIPDKMAQIDALVLPSRTVPFWREQFGHVLIEAMAMGVPIVGSSSGAIPEVIGRDDIIFPEEDAQTLASILERLVTDHDWRNELSLYGIKRVQDNFTHDTIARQLVALWQQVLASEGE